MQVRLPSLRSGSEEEDAEGGSMPALALDDRGGGLSSDDSEDEATVISISSCTPSLLSRLALA